MIPAETVKPGVRVLLLLMALPLLGALAFVLVEGWSFFDALYMAIITLTTVGFAEVHDLSSGGRIVVIVYLVVGLGFFAYGISELGELLIRGELRRALGKRQMDSAIQSLHNHNIVCGCGRTGRRLSDLLSEKGESFVVVDRDADVVEEARERGWSAVTGDATTDETLRALGVERAKGLAAVLSGDADNLFVVLSARLLNPGLKILARATDEESVDKMERAGADQVVNVHQIGASKMVQLLTNPSLVDFIEILDTEEHELDMVQIAVPPESERCNVTLAEADIRTHGIRVIGIRRGSGEFLFLPDSATKILAEDTLMAMGPADALERFLIREK